MTTLKLAGKAIWQWQFSQQAEKSAAAVAATLRAAAPSVTTWLVKCLDGSSWDSAFDTGGDAPSSLASWQHLAAEGAAAGLTVVPWVVPNHASDATAHARLGPALVVDLEAPEGADYWQDGAAAIPQYLAGLRAGGVTELYVSIDGRPAQLAALDVPAWGATVEALLPQVYWPAFQTPALANVGIVQACQQINPVVFPMLPYDAAAADLAIFWQACQKLGCQGCSLWRLGAANAAQLAAFDALELAPPKPHLDAAARLQLVGYVAGGSGVADLTTWLNQYSD